MSGARSGEDNVIQSSKVCFGCWVFLRRLESILRGGRAAKDEQVGEVSITGGGAIESVQTPKAQEQTHELEEKKEEPVVKESFSSFVSKLPVSTPKPPVSEQFVEIPLCDDADDTQSNPISNTSDEALSDDTPSLPEDDDQELEFWSAGLLKSFEDDKDALFDNSGELVTATAKEDTFNPSPVGALNENNSEASSIDESSGGEEGKETDAIEANSEPSTPSLFDESSGGEENNEDGAIEGKEGKRSEGRWLEIKDAASGRMYYYNEQTKKSVWTKPRGFDRQNLLFATQESGSGRLWVEAKDERGRIYYYDKSTLESRWDRPATLAVPELLRRRSTQRSFRKLPMEVDIPDAENESTKAEDEKESKQPPSPTVVRASKFAKNFVQTAGATARNASSSALHIAQGTKTKTFKSFGGLCGGAGLSKTRFQEESKS